MSGRMSISHALLGRAARGAPYWLVFFALASLYVWMGPSTGVNWLPPLLLACALIILSVVIKDWSFQRTISKSDGKGREGHWCAIEGRALAEDVQDQDILACHFRILSTENAVEITREENRRRSSEDKKTLRYEGVYQTPSGIDNGEAFIRFGGFPNLTDRMPERIESSILVNAKEKSKTAPSWIPAFLVREMLLYRTSHQVELALRYGKDPEERFRRVEAWMLKSGDQVWALGKLIDNELHPVSHRALGIPVYFGSKEEVLAKLQSTRGFFIGTALVFLGASLTVALFTLF